MTYKKGIAVTDVDNVLITYNTFKTWSAYTHVDALSSILFNSVGTQILVQHNTFDYFDCEADNRANRSCVAFNYLSFEPPMEIPPIVNFTNNQLTKEVTNCAYAVANFYSFDVNARK